MEHADLNEKAQLLREVYQETRGKAVHDLSRALAYSAQCATLKMPRKTRLAPQGPRQVNALAKFTALAAVKAPKQKPNLIKFVGPMHMPNELERAPEPAGAPKLPAGWASVWYKENAVPKPQNLLIMFKMYRVNSKRKPLAGLAKLYKRPVQAELLPPDEELSPSVEPQELLKMEQWLQHAREMLEAHEQRKQQKQAT